MRYVGNITESDAAKYKDARHTHSRIVNGRVVNYYDCWSHADEIPDTDNDRLNKTKTSSLDSLFRGIGEMSGESVDFDDED